MKKKILFPFLCTVCILSFGCATDSQRVEPFASQVETSQSTCLRKSSTDSSSTDDSNLSSTDESSIEVETSLRSSSQSDTEESLNYPDSFHYPLTWLLIEPEKVDIRGTEPQVFLKDPTASIIAVDLNKYLCWDDFFERGFSSPKEIEPNYALNICLQIVKKKHYETYDPEYERFECVENPDTTMIEASDMQEVATYMFGEDYVIPHQTIYFKTYPHCKYYPEIEAYNYPDAFGWMGPTQYPQIVSYAMTKDECEVTFYLPLYEIPEQRSMATLEQVEEKAKSVRENIEQLQLYRCVLKRQDDHYYMKSLEFL